jgi:hypothetical protein
VTVGGAILAPTLSADAADRSEGKDQLDETRLVMLGAQLLLGLQYRAAFSVGFRRLPVSF